MKSFEFTEEQFATLNDLAQKSFDETDPRSVNYKREIIRPKINWFLIALFIITPVALSLALGFLLKTLEATTLLKVLSIIGFNLLYLFVFLKQIVITLVKLYQFFAPEKVRLRCRFEPSCSQYMILAIEKYGLFKGLKKGINRLKRCNVKDGGYDYP